METAYTKTPRGWEAKTRVSLAKNWLLIICSARHDKTGCAGSYNILTDAMVHHIDEHGLLEHAFGISGKGDFNLVVSTSTKDYSRITRPAIEGWHNGYVSPTWIAYFKQQVAQYYARPDMQWREGGAELAKALWAELGETVKNAA